MPAAERLVVPVDGPLSDAELAGLFSPLAGARRIALAVSGGPDSLALLDSIDRWRRLPKRPEVVVLTVDHRLQAGSGQAAAKVRELAVARELPVRLLVRHGETPQANIEAAAREARYRLLIDACRDEGATHLVLAHHRDDVAETFLMRLRRGAGVFGLAAMRPVLVVGDVAIVRPFLSVPKSRLEATTAAAGWTPVDDPMNTDPRFARTAERRLLAQGGIDPAVVASVAGRMAEAAGAIDAEADATISRSATVDEFGIAWLDRVGFAEAAEDVRARVLVRLLMAVGGGVYPPRSDRLTGLLAAMSAVDTSPSWKRTLTGAVVEGRDNRFAVYRELGRARPEDRPLPPGSQFTWDRRFAVAAGSGAPPGLTVGVLGEEGRREVGATAETAGRGVPVAALTALPAIRSGPQILVVPRFRETVPELDITFRCVVADRLRRPPLFPEFPAE